MSLRHALLGLLADREASGYELMKTFQTSLAHVWPASQSQIYTELTRLSDEGLLKVTAEGARGRKDYAITEVGRAELLSWLAAPFPAPRYRSEMLLRVFFLRYVPPEQRAEFLEGQAAQAAERHRGMTALVTSLEGVTDSLAVDGRMALEYGVRLAAMQRDWAEWAAGQVRERAAG